MQKTPVESIQPVEQAPAPTKEPFMLKVFRLIFAILCRITPGLAVRWADKLFFDPILNWVNKYIKKPAEETVVNIKLEYIDTASTQSLYQILRQLNGVRSKDFVIMVNWYIEDADPEMKELGEMIEQRMGIEFQYVPY